MKTWSETKRALLLLGLLWATQAVLLIIWLKKDQQPPHWDQAVHVSSAFNIRQNIRQGRWHDLFFTKNWSGHPPYPPLAHGVMAVGQGLGRLVGMDLEDGSRLAHLIFLAVLMLGSYLLARHLWGGTAGIMAATVTSLSPPVLITSRELLVDFPLTAMAVLAYACWVLSNKGKQTKWALLFGLVNGLGMMVKWSFFLYLIPIYGDALWSLIRPNSYATRFNIVKACLISFAVMIPWYGPNMLSIVTKTLRSASLGKVEGDPSVASVASFTWYGKALAHQYSLAGLLIGLGALVWGMVKARSSRFLMSAWFICGYLIWSLVSNKDGRFIMPVGILLPLAVASLPYHLPKAAAGLLVVYAGLFNWWPGQTTLMRRPIPDLWPLNDIVACAASHRGVDSPPSTLHVVPNHECMNGTSFRWIIERKGHKNELNARSRLDQLGRFTEFILVKSGRYDVQAGRLDREAVMQEILNSKGWFHKSFKKIGEWNLPDQSQATLYQLRPDKAFVLKSGEKLPPDFLPGWSLEGIQIQARPDPQGSPQQTWEVSARKIEIKGAVISNVRSTWKGLVGARDDLGKPRLLRLDTVHIQAADAGEKEIAAFLVKRLNFVKDLQFKLASAEEMTLSGRIARLPIQIQFGVAPTRMEGSTLDVFAREIAVGPIHIPLHITKKVSLAAGKGLPYTVILGPLTVRACGAGEQKCLIIGDEHP